MFLPSLVDLILYRLPHWFCWLFKPEGAIDMKRRYIGHCNIGTDIKQASFLGQRGAFLCSGCKFYVHLNAIPVR